MIKPGSSTGILKKFPKNNKTVTNMNKKNDTDTWPLEVCSGCRFLEPDDNSGDENPFLYVCTLFALHDPPLEGDCTTPVGCPWRKKN